ncbi:MAG: hypothetical protein HOH60_07790 [Opitutae bacterium]|jgi:hypothetical protein|nr:hypothetical protein [Opitutae bacterium]MBT7404861.1 hypothetical protein [Opitutae bacterium]
MKNNNLGLVLIASALVIMAGTISLGMAGLIEAVSPHRGLGYGVWANYAGIGLLILGVITFLKTFFRYLDKKD